MSGPAPTNGTRPADRRRTGGPARRAPRVRWFTFATVLAAAFGVLTFHEPPTSRRRPFDRQAKVASAAPSVNAFGKSGEVKVRFALPGEPVEYPLEVQGDPRRLRYQWVRLADSVAADSARPLAGAELVAPPAPGFYQLALLEQPQEGAEQPGEQRHVIDGLTLSVLVPFSAKSGSTLNGYRIGTYLAERLGTARSQPPEGFVEVRPQDLAMPITKHLTLADFVSHDGQEVWPRYTAVNPRLLDKLELVMAKIAGWRGAATRPDVHVAISVNSGFRAPVYNRSVRRSASDSRHQYGDAADVKIDANGDGRYTLVDSKLVAQAVEEVEREHPELAGGMGLYTSRRYNTPYVHIDARGRRARWRG